MQRLTDRKDHFAVIAHPVLTARPCSQHGHESRHGVKRHAQRVGLGQLLLTRGRSRILQWRVSNPSERGTGDRAPKVEHFPGILYFQI